jgi:hypothetical protein
MTGRRIAAMADETHKLQKDPPEGSREVVEHEFKRQSRQPGSTGSGKPGRGTAARPGRNGKTGPGASR